MIQATVDLLSTEEIATITVDRITERAGLASGHVLVHRYFGSRADLMSAVARRLARDFVGAVSAPVDEVSNPTGDPAVGALVAVSRGVELVRRRALVLAELQTVAADPAPHAEDHLSMAAAVRDRLSAIVSNERVLRPLAFKVLTLVQAEATQGEWTGMSQRDRDEVRGLILGELALAEEIAARLGW